MRRAAPARQARTEVRASSEPAEPTSAAEPIRRAVGLTGLAVGPVAGRPADPAVASAGSSPAGTSTAQASAAGAAGHTGLAALRRQADRHGGPTLRRMTVGGAAKASSVSGTTRTKHVMAAAGQAADAQAGYGSRTYVTSDAVLTAAVDADAHDFAAGAARSARYDCQASVPIYQWDKTGAPPGGLAAGQPVNKTVDGAATLCEIGAVKTGTGDISITHFKKV